jgi:hypothetical protein
MQHRPRLDGSFDSLLDKIAAPIFHIVASIYIRLQADLDDRLKEYNEARPPQGDVEMV